jgi:hypothetical protein
MMDPVGDFVRKRKPLAPAGVTFTDCDDGSVVASDDARLASLELAKADAGAKMKRYGLEIDLLRLGDSQFLKQTLGCSEMRHD